MGSSLGTGNGYYSPETCVLIPKTLNLALVASLKGSKTNRNKSLPIGVQKQGNRFVATLSESTTKYLGMFKTIQEAYNCYLNAKGKYLLALLEGYKEYMPSELFTKLAGRIKEIYNLKEND